VTTTLDAVDRLADDLDRYPDSPTLNASAIRHPSTGTIVAQAIPAGPLAMAYANGADAELIVRAERLAARVGERGDRGHLYRAVRLDHAVRAMNRRLCRKVHGQALGTVTVLAHWATPDPARSSRGAAEVESAGPIHDTRGYPPDSDADPPPLDSAMTSPHRPCAPPLSLTRGHEWLSRVGTVGTNPESEGVVRLIA
jgi:hypothetical protein